ncbi:hypothetical protein [Nonomuraea africana]|uniref:hypothetical protein n=1 Tax=Nonomuraea africana TaxID=46171 RepID=UPI0033CAE232
MTIFDAVLRDDRPRVVELSFKLNQADHRPRRVLLIEQLRQTDTLPFVWRFAHEVEIGLPREARWRALTGQGAPVLTVVAAPGVSVLFEGFPDDYTPAPGLPKVNIFRVQDPDVLPRLASDIPSVHLVGTYEEAQKPWISREGAVQIAGAAPRGPQTFPYVTHHAPDRQRHFIVEQLPSSVVINHVASGDRWTITVPAHAEDLRFASDHLARYAFEIDVDSLGPMLKIVTTPYAQVTLMEGRIRSRLWGVDLEPSPSTRKYWALWEVDLIQQVPPQGIPIKPATGWRRIDKPRRIPNPDKQALALKQTLLDVVVGFIPIVGDVVDVAELLYGVVTGEDKWGNPLSTGELALLGLGAVLPFVSGPAARRARGLVQRFATHADEAAELAQRVRQANLGSADTAVIQRFEALVIAGRRIPTELWNEALPILRRIPGPQPTIDVLLNAKGNGFAHTELQAAYQRYIAPRGEEALKPIEWARKTRGRSYDLFVTLLGPDYAKRLVEVGGRPLNLLDIARPDKYTSELLAADLDTVLKSPRLWERLGKLLDELPDPGAKSIGFLRRQVSASRFRILKGNLAEIFAEAIQRAQLELIAKDNPGALLVSGVRVRLMRDGKPSKSVLFSDNIIIVKKGNRLEVKMVFEVKAGFKGGQEATEQIFEWIEGRLTDGSQLILPKGSTFTAADGRTWSSKKELSFTWKPKNPNVPTVTYLASAERCLITASGTSTLGIDSAKGVGPKVYRPKDFPRSSAELDYLAASLLLGRVASAKTLLPAAQ